MTEILTRQMINLMKLWSFVLSSTTDFQDFWSGGFQGRVIEPTISLILISIVSNMLFF